VARPKLSPLEFRIMKVFWERGAVCIRDVQEAFPEDDRPAYTTVQTSVYRLEAKNAVRRVRKISNAHIFEAVISRTAEQNRLVGELLSLFGGRAKLVVAHLAESGELTLDDIQEAETAIREYSKKGKAR
jgi:BlaI family transcriptional regulator, penicillinase repressor